ncbi:hypothetical protein DY000_02051685 [Brassica cretica]|uniref:Uncharacterized protein n=1 Tax=Brassica cretica TaxID=69181 RepID=A0ABQ7FB53_BRACR|nr:hypothetical protein DY000_02019894 [Brassica cretica]KAF3612211.1 hypothetical protein DY000_02051685 [Brassica cretica]
MGNIFYCCTGGRGSNVPPVTESNTVQPQSHSQSVLNQSVSSASKSNHSSLTSIAERYNRG